MATEILGRNQSAYLIHVALSVVDKLENGNVPLLKIYASS